MITCLLAVSVLGGKSQAQDLLSNVYGRDYQLLNGKWGAIVDLYDQGERMQVYKNRKPQDNKQFYEYSFDGGLVLNVPADFNSQMPELKFYEGTVWYGRSFDTPKTDGKRLFLYFGAVSYRSKIYLNGEKIASHEGGFTPFQVEITDKVKQKDNFLVVKVNNTRTTDAIPAMSFDWWNYGGITRDVMLVSVPQSYIKDLIRSKAWHQRTSRHPRIGHQTEHDYRCQRNCPGHYQNQKTATLVTGCSKAV